MSLPYARKQLGQHWLIDKASLESIADAAMVSEVDSVLEIGPGTGTLTDVLVQTGAKVTALEFDTERAKELKAKYEANLAVHVIEGDIRSFDLSSIVGDYKIVANIPYYLTANLLRKLTDDNHKPVITSLLVQKEVAQRVVAKPGSLSQVAVFVQIYYHVDLGVSVPAYLFTPPPKVDSQVLILKKRARPLVDVTDDFSRVVKAGFGEKRKKLRSSLSGGLQLPKEVIESALAAANLSPNARAQELSIEQWQGLYQALPLFNT